MTRQTLIGALVSGAGLTLLALALPAGADVVDDLEDIGPDCTPVFSRVIGGVTVTISTASGFNLTARTYYDGTCLAFDGHEGAITHRLIGEVSLAGGSFQAVPPTEGVSPQRRCSSSN